MSEIWAFFGRQRQKLGRRIQSFFGGSNSQAEITSWKEKLEKRAEDAGGVEIGNILPKHESFLDDMQEMLNAVCSEDRELVEANQLLQKEFESISGAPGSQFYERGRKLSRGDLPDNADALGDENGAHSSSRLSLSGRLSPETDRKKGRERADTVGDSGFVPGSDSSCFLYNQHSQRKNANNCAQEQEMTNITIDMEKNKDPTVPATVRASKTKAGGASKVTSDLKTMLVYSTTPKRRKRQFSTKYSSPEIRRRAASLADLTEERYWNNLDFDDLLSEAELASTTPRSDKEDDKNTHTLSETIDERQREVMGAASGRTQGMDEPRSSESFLRRKMRQIFGRKSRRERHCTAELLAENEACPAFFPAQRTSGKEILPLVRKEEAEDAFALQADAEMNSAWWEFLDAMSSASSDVCSWEELVQMVDRKQELEQHDERKARVTNEFETALAAEVAARTLDTGAESSVRPGHPGSQSASKEQADVLDRGDSAGDPYRAKATPLLPYRDIPGTAPGNRNAFFTKAATVGHSSSGSAAAKSSGLLSGRDMNMSKPKAAAKAKKKVKRASITKKVRQRWSARRQYSAPELRQFQGLEREPTHLSYHDLPLGHRTDVMEGFPLPFAPKDDEATFLWGEDGYRHYKLLMMIETKKKIQRIKEAKQSIINKYIEKQETLEQIVKVAKAYYNDPTDTNRKEWKELRRAIRQSSVHSISDIRHKLAQLPDYWPVFTILMMLAQVALLTVMCSQGGFARFGVLSQKELKKSVQTFLGAETFHRWNTPNPWLGPPIKTILASGASLAPCLRHERYIREYSLEQEYQKFNGEVFGCCQMRGPINAAGTTTEKECTQWTNSVGVWGLPACSQRAPGRNSIAHVMRPCCVDHRGTCQMLSHAHCHFIGGDFFPQKEHCVQVNCIRQGCRLGRRLYTISSDDQETWRPADDEKLQWWRLVVSLALTFGVLHCLPLLLIEWLLMRPLEQSAGWLRLTIVFCLSGVAGQIVAGIVQPYVPHVGSTSAVAGMVGEAAVELSQAWHLLDRPGVEALRLSAFLLFLLLMALLPYVSFFAVLGGLLAGALCALVLMPYITFDSQSRQRRIMMIITGAGLLAAYYVTILFHFIQTQPSTCNDCKSVDCLTSSENNVCNEWDLFG